MLSAFQATGRQYQQGLNAARAAAQQLNQEARDAAGRSVAMATTSIALILLLGFTIAAGAGWLVTRGISRPLSRLTEVVRRLAGGDTTVAVPDTDRGDELGAISKAVQVFKDNAIERARLLAGE